MQSTLVPGGSSLPTLPAGYEAQPDMGFRDASGQLLYAFHRVYGEETRPDLVEMRGPAMGLNEDLCYWAVSWSTTNEGRGSELPGGRWVTFAQARAGGGARMTFRRFSSLELMRAELPALLRVPPPIS